MRVLKRRQNSWLCKIFQCDGPRSNIFMFFRLYMHRIMEVGVIIRFCHESRYLFRESKEKCGHQYLWQERSFGSQVLVLIDRSYSGRLGLALGFQKPSWETKYNKSSKRLFGPCSLRGSRMVYDPCIQHGCFVGCPCILCPGVDQGTRSRLWLLLKQLFLTHQNIRIAAPKNKTTKSA